MLRNRGNRDALAIVKEFDAFPKVPEEYTKSSKIGGSGMYNFLKKKSRNSYSVDCQLWRLTAQVTCNQPLKN